jgi:quercetin dioxygenase-like cupin family protein
MVRSLKISVAACALLGPAGLHAAACGVARPDARDAVAVAPDRHKVLIDNDMIRILDVTLPPGSQEPAHSHVWPAILVLDTPRPGAPPQVRNFESRWQEPRALDQGGNSGRNPVHYLEIDLKKGDCVAVKNPPLPPTDGVVIHDPTIKVPFENEYVRVLEIEVRPGESEPPHTHTWPSVVYYYRLPTSRRGTADSKPPVDRPELTKQQVTFEDFAQPVHTLMNTGTYLYQAHRIEIKPVTDVAVTKP